MVRTTGEENEPLSRFLCADDKAKVTSTRHQVKVPATKSQKDRCLDKSFDKTSTTDLLKTKQADSCLNKEKKKEKETKKKAGEGDTGRIHLSDPASSEAYGRDQK